MGIISEGTKNFSALEEQIGNNLEQLELLSNDVRTRLLETENIVTFSREYDNLPPLLTVDGGVVNEKLSHTDLIITGASLGESSYEQPGGPIYTDEDDIPATAYVVMLQHDSKNSNVANSLMAIQEIALIGRCLTDHEEALIIIDGGWLSSLTTIIIELTSSKASALALYDFIAENRALMPYIKKTIKTITNPDEASRKLVALSKSDSKGIWIDRLEEIDKELGDRMRTRKIRDRALASTILKSGEALSPTYIDAGHSLIKGLDKWVDQGSKLYFDKDRNDPEIKALLTWILKYSHTNVPNLHVRNGAKLWSTYFKPNNFANSSKALRIEFIRETALVNPEHPHTSALVLVEDVIKYLNCIDEDVVADNILEPWCQYIADRRAKEVSQLANIVRMSLASGKHAGFFLNNYRT